ncbi:MAG: hypothetical protein M1833_002854 [Piccolia ochrophora]|nr:MAG: hypothetical protein M1833_002854 [Piccolia ochrophora]
MGSVAIWSTHFVGNRAIVMGDGEDALQFVFHPGFVALSIFVPILVLLPAFLVVGSHDKVGKIRVAIGGSSSGLATCAMHFLGEAGIVNYALSYSIPHVLGAALVAVFACTTALTISFALRVSWTDSWWKRALCGLLLAGGVTGMHWITNTGTSYRLKRLSMPSPGDVTQNQTMIVVIALAVCAIGLLLILAILARRHRRQSADRVQQVVLACATFDPNGRLLVTPEGLLPSQTITKSYTEKSLDDVFSISHPTFLWIYRLSRNWRGIFDLLPSMRKHVHAGQEPVASQPRMVPRKSHSDDAEGSDDSSVIFRELFCVAAAELAEQINEPLEKLGVLYDEIMSTGTTGKISRALFRRSSSYPDVELGSSNPFAFGRGQLLFVVRRASKSEAARLQSQGFRFAGLQNVVEILARRMEVGREELTQSMDRMRSYSIKESMLNPGVHVGCFAVRASVGGGFDVLVRSEAKNLIPTVPFPISCLDDWQLSFLKQMDGWTFTNCLRWLRSKSDSCSEKEQMFITQLDDAFVDMAETMVDNLFQEARLVASPIHVPCLGSDDSYFPGHASIIAFHTIVPIQTRSPSPVMEFSPLSFFKCQQHVYRNTPDHEVFARRVHREFSPILEIDQKRQAARTSRLFRSSQEIPRLTPSKNAPPAHRYKWLSTLDRRASYSSSEPEKSKSGGKSEESHAWGGILVSQEVNIRVDEVGPEISPIEIDPLGVPLGSSGLATTEMEDPKTFVDSLFTICVESR